MKIVLFSFLLLPSVVGALEVDADSSSPIKEGNLRSLQQQQQQSHYGIPIPAPVSCETCPCGYNDGCNACGCNEDGFAFCTLRFCAPEEFGEPSCNKCEEERCCDLSDRPKGAIEAPLCCPDGTWVGNIGDGSGTCPNGVVVSSRLGNEGDVCQPTCDDCPCGYNDGCNECMCGPDGPEGCTERACLVQGTPFCKECPVSDKCCDPLKEPGMFGNPPSREGHQCCGVTGEWLGSIGDGKTIFCGNQLISSGYGEPCFEPKCCDLADRPVDDIEAPLCCADGTWAGNIGDGSATCPDGSLVVSGKNEGDICEPSCESCPCGYNDGCNDCSCGPDGDLLGCTDLACLLQGPPSCNKCSTEPLCCDPLKEPGQFGNPIGFEGHRCCAVTGEWVISIGDARTFPCGGSLITSGFGERCYETKCCDPLEKPGAGGGHIPFEEPLCCSDGTWIGNRGDGQGLCQGNLINFETQGEICDDQVFCTQDVMTCPDGSFVGRDPDNGCSFFPCPKEEIFCTQDVKECPDGSFVGRDPDSGCSFFPCPEVVACTQDAKICPGGSAVGRDPVNGCNFFPCPVVQCPPKRRWCRWTRRWVRLDPSTNCEEFFPCYWHWHWHW